MADLGFYTDKSFLAEQWTEFGVSVAIIFVRLGVRLRMVGARGFQGDDYLAFLVSTSGAPKSWTLIAMAGTRSPDNGWDHGSLFMYIAATSTGIQKTC